MSTTLQRRHTDDIYNIITIDEQEAVISVQRRRMAGWVGAQWRRGILNTTCADDSRWQQITRIGLVHVIFRSNRTNGGSAIDCIICLLLWSFSARSMMLQENFEGEQRVALKRGEHAKSKVSADFNRDCYGFLIKLWGEDGVWGQLIALWRTLWCWCSIGTIPTLLLRMGVNKTTTIKWWSMQVRRNGPAVK